MSITEFHEAVVPADLGELLDFDRRIFAQFPEDLFSAEDWSSCHSYWMVVDGIKVGCCAFEWHVDFDETPRRGCLYIASTGILPEYQGKGFGREQKEWEVEYARQNGFSSIVTNMRESNHRIIRLNEALGFKFRENVPDYYTLPVEAAIVMELSVKLHRDARPQVDVPSASPGRDPPSHISRLSP
jgi:GNAT superfamily N-acetyltransferase